MTVRSRELAFWGGGLLVVGLTLAVFLPTLKNDFVSWDDAENFLRNPYYRGLGWANLRWMFTTAHTGHYIPVTWLTLGLDYLLWGLNPWGYHLTSIVLHAVNALLFYLVAYRLLALALPPHPALSPRGGEGALESSRGEEGNLTALQLGAVVAALLFSVHPLRVESVAWVTERRDLVVGLFTLLTLMAYVTAHRRGEAGRLQAGWYWTAVGFFALALLSKSIVVALPAVLLALDFYPLRRAAVLGETGRQRPLVRLVAEKAPLLLLSAAVSALMLAIGARRELLTTLDSLSLGQRLAVSAYDLGFYLWKTVIPWPLSPLYPLRYPILWLSPEYLVPSLVVFTISAGAILARRRWPAGLTVWVAYVALLLPVLGILHNGTQIAADRYTYLACLGWALLAGGGVGWCWQAARQKAVTPGLGRLVVLLTVTVIVSLAAFSTLQIRVWRDSETLWRHALDLDPDNPFAHFHLGGTLARLGRAEQARSELDRAVKLVPEQLPTAKSVFHSSLGLLLQLNGDSAGAEQNYLASLRYSEYNVIALSNIGVILAQRGEQSAALGYFLRALRVAPGFPNACLNAQIVAARLRVTPKELDRCPKGTAEGGNGQPRGDGTGEGVSPSPAVSEP